MNCKYSGSVTPTEQTKIRQKGFILSNLHGEQHPYIFETNNTTADHRGQDGNETNPLPVGRDVQPQTTKTFTPHLA